MHDSTASDVAWVVRVNAASTLGRSVISVGQIDLSAIQSITRGLRYPVEMLLELLASGMSIEKILDVHRDLERDDLLAALEFGALISGNRVTPLAAA